MSEYGADTQKFVVTYRGSSDNFATLRHAFVHATDLYAARVDFEERAATSVRVEQVELCKPNTPGYNHHLEIWFKITRNSKKTAWFYSRAAMRAIRLPLADAELWIAQEQATKVDGHPFQP